MPKQLIEHFRRKELEFLGKSLCQTLEQDIHLNEREIEVDTYHQKIKILFKDENKMFLKEYGKFVRTFFGEEHFGKFEIRFSKTKTNPDQSIVIFFKVKKILSC